MVEAVFNLRVGGDYACFSRPEFKAERVSYLVMTPSAARGLCESIFWKPEIRWEVRRISVLKPIRQASVLRNELADRQGTAPIFVEQKRQQRTSLILKDVEYVIQAEMLLNAHAEWPLAKYRDQFRRRLERGQCHHTPYLGTREFAAWFDPASGDESPEPMDLDLGSMLFDIRYCSDDRRPELEFRIHDGQGIREVKGYAEAVFFEARLASGVLDVPPALYLALSDRR